MNKLGSLPVKTPVPLTWALPGLVTLLSMVSLLLHVTAGPGRNLSASLSERVATSARRLAKPA